MSTLKEQLSINRLTSIRRYLHQNPELIAASSPIRRLTVAIGAWTGSDVLIGEIPLTYILETITESSNPSVGPGS